MHLPDNKKDRQKILILVALGVFAAAYGIWLGAYEPIRVKREAAAKRCEELDADLRLAKAQIGRAAEMKRELADTTQSLLDRSERNMLHPRLGNYLLQAREILEGHGRAFGAVNVQVAEIGLVEPPKQPKKETEYAVRLYSARVSAECGYEAFVRWIRALEEENPLIAVSLITVSAQPENPQIHLVRFEVQWPVWVDPAMRETVAQKASEILGDTSK